MSRTQRGKEGSRESYSEAGGIDSEEDRETAGEDRIRNRLGEKGGSEVEAGGQVNAQGEEKDGGDSGIKAKSQSQNYCQEPEKEGGGARKTEDIREGPAFQKV